MDGIDPPANLPPEPSGNPTGLAESFRQLGPAGSLGIVWGTAPAVVGTLLLVYMGTVSEWLRNHGETESLALYIVAFIVSAGLGLLPTYSQAILGGWCFGFAVGYPAAMAGFVGASIVGFAIVKIVARDRVEKMVARNAKAVAARDALIGRGFWKTFGIVTLLRVPPNSPFALTNLAMTSTGVRFPAFVLGTMVGMAPRTGIVAYLGSTLQQGISGEEAVRKPWWYFAISVVLTIIVLGVIGLLAQRAIARVSVPKPGAGKPQAAAPSGPLASNG